MRFHPEIKWTLEDDDCFRARCECGCVRFIVSENRRERIIIECSACGNARCIGEGF